MNENKSSPREIDLGRMKPKRGRREDFATDSTIRALDSIRPMRQRQERKSRMIDLGQLTPGDLLTLDPDEELRRAIARAHELMDKVGEQTTELTDASTIIENE